MTLCGFGKCPAWKEINTVHLAVQEPSVPRATPHDDPQGRICMEMRNAQRRKRLGGVNAAQNKDPCPSQTDTVG